METEAVGVCKDTAATVFPGFKFSPTDVELISYYLKRKMDGLEKSVEVIPDADIYNLEPWDFPDMSIVKSDTEWFFFGSRGKKYPHGSQNRRATKMGYWKATGKELDVKSSSEVIGTKRTLVFHIGRAPKAERTEWIMHEYSMKEESLDDAMVVCRLRRNKEFHSCTSQKAPEPNVAAEKQMILQSGPSCSGSPSDWDDMVDFYLAGEPGETLLNEMAETAVNLQVNTEEDFFGDTLRDEIINLDETVNNGSTPIRSLDTRISIKCDKGTSFTKRGRQTNGSTPIRSLDTRISIKCDKGTSFTKRGRQTNGFTVRRKTITEEERNRGIIVELLRWCILDQDSEPSTMGCYYMCSGCNSNVVLSRVIRLWK